MNLLPSIFVKLLQFSRNHISMILVVKLINAIIILFSILLAFSNGEADDLLTVNKNFLFNARLDNVNLSEVRMFFEKNYGVTFCGQDSLFQTKITSYFENISLDEALKRVLIRKNYAFVYNSHGELLIVTLFPGINDSALMNNIIKYDENSNKKTDDVSDPFLVKDYVDDITRSMPIKIDQNRKNKNDSIINQDFQVIKNAPAPGG